VKHQHLLSMHHLGRHLSRWTPSQLQPLRWINIQYSLIFISFPPYFLLKHNTPSHWIAWNSTHLYLLHWKNYIYKPIASR
jgi:hypothetical protein